MIQTRPIAIPIGVEKNNIRHFIVHVAVKKFADGNMLSERCVEFVIQVLAKQFQNYFTQEFEEEMMKYQYIHREDRDIRICLTAETLKEAALICLLGKTIKKPIGTFGHIQGETFFIWIVIPLSKEKYANMEVGNGYTDC